MIDRGVRHVDRADPVSKHTYALALQTTQDRARGTGSERGGGDTGFPRDGFANGQAKLALRILSGYDLGALQEVGLIIRLQGGRKISTGDRRASYPSDGPGRGHGVQYSRKDARGSFSARRSASKIIVVRSGGE